MLKRTSSPFLEGRGSNVRDCFFPSSLRDRRGQSETQSRPKNRGALSEAPFFGRRFGNRRSLAAHETNSPWPRTDGKAADDKNDLEKPSKLEKFLITASCLFPLSRGGQPAQSEFIMQPLSTLPVSHGVVKLVSPRDLDRCDAWKRAFDTRCKDHRYYEIIEKTLQSGFEHYYLLLEDHSGSVRAVQPVFFVRQNLVEGGPGKIRSIVDF